MPDAIFTSWEVANVIREYERFSTAAMNALSVQTSRYLNNLQNQLTENGFRANLRRFSRMAASPPWKPARKKPCGI